MYYLIVQLILISTVVNNARYEHQCQCQEQDISGNFCYSWTCKQEITSNGACFQSDQDIQIVDQQSNKTIKLDQLKDGDTIINYDQQSGQLFKDKIIGFLDHQQISQEFILIDLQSNQSVSEIQITAEHLIYIRRNNQTYFVQANQVDIDDELLVHGVFYKVTNLSRSIKSGIIAPLTESGTISVNGVLSSCYAHVKHHDLAQLGFLPFRMFHKLRDLGVILKFIEPEIYQNQHLDSYVRLLKNVNSFVFKGYFY